MNRIFPLLAMLLFEPVLLASPAAAGSAQDGEPFLQLEDDDTVVFLGDSITHQCLYTQYLETFFYTRYPHRRIRFHNAGVSGDRAAHALARFGDDVAALEPDVVTLLLGMNDGRYEPFHAETFRTYRRDMTALLDRIAGIGARAVVLSPTMFDHHQHAVRMQDPTFRFGDRHFDRRYNALMGYYGAWLREAAGKRRLPSVDLWGRLNDLTFARRRLRPDFTLIEDAIHPGAAGQFVMAHTILSRARPERPRVDTLTLQRRDGEWFSDRSAAVTGIEWSDAPATLEFRFTARALPWVVPEKSSTHDLKWDPTAPATLGYRLTRAGRTLGQEQLRVRDLPPGDYRLTIDGDPIDVFTREALAAGVDLHRYQETPQCRQALEVARLDRERNDEAVRPMRDLWSRVKRLRNGDPARFEQAYPELKERIDDLRARAAEYENRIYETARPEPRRYFLERLAPGDQQG